MKSMKRQIQVKRVSPSPQQQLLIPEQSVESARDQLLAAGRLTSPGKQVAITRPLAKRNSHTGLILGGVMLIALSLVQVGARSNRAVALGISPPTELAEEYDGVPAADMVGQVYIVNGQATRPNPKISALEMFFCRGRQTSTACSGKPYHPYLRWWQEWSNDPTTSLENKEQAVREITATFGKDTYAY